MDLQALHKLWYWVRLYHLELVVSPDLHDLRTECCWLSQLGNAVHSIELFASSSVTMVGGECKNSRSSKGLVLAFERTGYYFEMLQGKLVFWDHVDKIVH